MNIRRGRSLRGIGWPMLAKCALLLIAGWLLWHAWQGDHGWLAAQRLESEIATTRQAVEALQQQRQELERDVRQLRPATLDPDLLDEQARRQLNYSAEGETVILLPPEDIAPQHETVR